MSPHIEQQTLTRCSAGRHADGPHQADTAATSPSPAVQLTNHTEQTRLASAVGASHLASGSTSSKQNTRAEEGVEGEGEESLQCDRVSRDGAAAYVVEVIVLTHA